MMLIDVYVKQTKKGLGVFTTTSIKKGTRLWSSLLVDYDVTKYPVDYVEKYASYDRKNNIFLCTDLAIFMNHSCEPNSDGEFATQDIAKDEEITFDYSKDYCPPDDDWAMECKCGSSNCMKIVRYNKGAQTQ